MTDLPPRDVPVVILAGGLGTRISEETATRPKPMIEIGGKPLLWHIMKIYGSWGFRRFIICLGYKGYVIKEYFNNYNLHTSDLTIEVASNTITSHKTEVEDWSVTLCDTGENSMTGGRIGRIAKYIDTNEFCLTYGDGVADIDLMKLVRFHRASGRAATVTGVRPLARFGGLDIEGDRVRRFREKPPEEGGWINGGFFVLNREVLDRITGDSTVWEQEPLESLAAEDQLGAYRHQGFWWAVDSLRDKNHLEMLWEQGKAAWRVW